MEIAVTTAEDPRLADYVRLRDTQLRHHLEAERGVYIAEGEKVIRRAAEAGGTPRSFLLAGRWLPGLADVLAKWPGVPVYVGDEAMIERLTGFHVHRGALACFERPEPRTVADLLAGELAGRTRSRIAVLEGLVDHANVGAIFRSAAALGVDAVLVTPRCADPLYRRSIKVSMGTVFQVPWVRADPWPAAIGQLQDAGYVVAGMTLGEGAITLDELVAADHPKLALVFGTEGHGLTPKADSLLDARVTIPMMHGVDSLNVAASSAVAFWATR
ncbi:TrmH family RNA methyltransferase [Parenemella sanctibonifatiensis]|uniref:rRNA methyltransferase n=1 Tax=Parenemella sanctibonifatiensis TaxID=2016505 RepID=A0A255E9L7_9ACTN|nr:RNA methyltransferase [Parenemella sanctibonifatiensis]OYN88267.1 rRNA methyltransferase [Parenemella sanctibonifatiensis]